jgi:hypothetical protein
VVGRLVCYSGGVAGTSRSKSHVVMRLDPKDGSFVGFRYLIVLFTNSFTRLSLLFHGILSQPREASQDCAQ